MVGISMADQPTVSLSDIKTLLQRCLRDHEIEQVSTIFEALRVREQASADFFRRGCTSGSQKGLSDYHAGRASAFGEIACVLRGTDVENARATAKSVVR